MKCAGCDGSLREGGRAAALSQGWAVLGGRRRSSGWSHPGHFSRSLSDAAPGSSLGSGSFLYRWHGVSAATAALAASHTSPPWHKKNEPRAPRFMAGLVPSAVTPQCPLLAPASAGTRCDSAGRDGGASATARCRISGCQQIFHPKRLLALGHKVKCHLKCTAIKFEGRKNPQ